MKKLKSLFVAGLLITACSKNTVKPSATVIAPIDVTGSWSIYSTTENNNPTITADQYPCLAENVITFKSDSTWSAAYSGTDVCYTSPKGVGASTEGTPGAAPNTGTWHRNGNNIMLGAGSTSVVTNVNGKLTLTETDIFTLHGSTNIYISVLNKKK